MAWYQFGLNKAPVIISLWAERKRENPSASHGMLKLYQLPNPLWILNSVTLFYDFTTFYWRPWSRLNSQGRGKWRHFMNLKDYMSWKCLFVKYNNYHRMPTVHIFFLSAIKSMFLNIQKIQHVLKIFSFNSWMQNIHTINFKNCIWCRNLLSTKCIKRQMY